MKRDYNEKHSLYIPLGLKARAEYFNGFGKEELLKSIICIAIGGGLDLLYYLISGSLATAIVAILTIASGAVLIFVKDANNISVVDQIKFMISFEKSQKKYKYVAEDEWR